MENKALPEIAKKNVSLKDCSTFKIGGEAEFFCVCRDEAETRTALDFAVVNRLPIFVIGRGSNLLISDKGLKGLVLKVDDTSMDIKEKESGYEVVVGCGSYLTKIALDMQKSGIGGMEWASGIPGSLGGAICNNAGAHGKNMGGIVERVRVLELIFNKDNKYPEDYELREMEQSQCGFSYRHSIFKDTNKYLILNAALRLQKRNPESIQEEMGEYVKARIAKQPLEYPNIGSIFKNPVLNEAEMENFFRKFPDTRDMFMNNTIPAGWLIDQAGLRGKQIGGAMVSEKHANFIINTGGAKAEDVVILISFIKQKVRAKFDIQLHEEIEYVGFDS